MIRKCKQVVNKTVQLSLCFGFVAAASFANAGDSESGKELYHDVDINQTINGVNYANANCETCHQSSVYTRDDKLASSYEKLESYVERCNTNLDVGWFPEDVSDVASYLNEEFYKFPK